MKRAFFAVVLLSLGACSSISESFRESAHFVDVMFNMHLDERDYSIDPTLKFEEATLETLRANPKAYLNMNVTFTAMMKDHDENRWEGSYTGLNKTKFYNFSVWPKGEVLWNENGYASALDTLYVAKNNPFFHDYLDIKKFQVIEIRGRVASDFTGEPWIECYFVSVQSSPVYTWESLEGLVRGMTEYSNKNYAAAAAALEKAKPGTLPTEARAGLAATLGTIYHNRGNISRKQSDLNLAINNFSSSLGYRPSEAVQKQLEAAQRDLNRQIQIDRRRAEEDDRHQRDMEEKKRQIERDRKEAERKRLEAERRKKNK